MKQIAVFAHYDKDSIIDDYVVYYLKSLKNLCEKVVFVSACDIASEELAKLDGIADYMIANSHDEYDFGSYKRGFLFLRENKLSENADRLIFANDSCYAPLFPLENVFEKMNASECDFWGITRNKFGLCRKNNRYFVCVRPHVQSYFMVFNSKIFNSDAFFQFMSGIERKERKNDVVIDYELGLSEFLTKLGYKSDVYVKDFYEVGNATIFKWRQLLQTSHSPFVKCNLLRKMYPNMTFTDDWHEVLTKYSDYPCELIEHNLKRTALTGKSAGLKIIFPKRIMFDLLSCLPNRLRSIVCSVIGRILKMQRNN